MRLCSRNWRMTESIDQKLARVAARLQRERDECEVCEARNERAAIMEYEANVPRGTAEQLAREAWPCRHL
jgi:hypothetical protein